MGTNSSKVKSPRAMPPNSPRETPAHVAGEKILEEENFSSLRTEFLKDDVLAALEAYLKYVLLFYLPWCILFAVFQFDFTRSWPKTRWIW